MSLPRRRRHSKINEKYLPPLSNPSYKEKIMALEEAILAKEVEMEKLDTTIWSTTADESIINAYSIKEFKGSIQTSKPIYWTAANPTVTFSTSVTYVLPTPSYEGGGTLLYLDGGGFSVQEPDQDEDDWYGF